MFGPAALAASLLPISAPAAAQGLPVASSQEIVAGTRSCMAATGARGVDPAKLQADGWRRTSVSNQGKAIENALFFGRGHLLLSLSAGGPAKVCSIVARIQSNAALGGILGAMSQGLGVPGKNRPQELNTAYWFPAQHIVQMKLTGQSDAPSVRIAVGSTVKK